MIATLVGVAAAGTAGVALLGALPGWIAGDRGMARVRTVQDAERRLAARIIIPAFFPDRLGWPPAEVRVAGGRGGSVLLAFGDRAGAPSLLLAQGSHAGAGIAPGLLGSPRVVASRETAVGSRPARLSTVVVGGEVWQELAWKVNGRAFVLRSRGGLDELFRIAHSTGGETR